MSDHRAYLRPKRTERGDSIASVLGEDVDTNILQPLYNTGGALLLPYTPTITNVGGVATYESYEFTHSNYNQLAFQKSKPNPLSVSAQFTSRTPEEARYTLAAIHFFRTVTKMHTGEMYDEITDTTVARPLAGLPPPILEFNYLGPYMFNKVPVVVESYSFDLPDQVDYVPVSFNGVETFVPTLMNIVFTITPQYNPDKVRSQFNLEDFRSGNLIKKGYL